MKRRSVSEGMGLSAAYVARLAMHGLGGLLYVPSTKGRARPVSTTLAAETKKLKAFYDRRPRPWRWYGNAKKRTRLLRGGRTWRAPTRAAATKGE